jgi:hypothetical protein
MSKKKDKKKAKGKVTVFTITYFDMAPLERQALLDLYSDHAWRFGQRHGVEGHTSVTTYPTMQQWEES